MTNSPGVELFWNEYLQEHPLAADTYEVWSFGDNARMADELLELVLQGIKTGTASNYQLYEAEGAALPQAGGHSIILDSKGEPQVIVATTRVEVVPFDEISAEFAYSEGEGDRSLEYWRREHERFFTREARELLNQPFDPQMKVVCENFKVVYLPSTRQ
ncbi:ASCH domain-containing protein [Paenibacillus albidus]|uniref:ASCH domain-containing protein n=1 Tax=Paenibacillus albidus TaxID=2041023 RepID=UPI001BE9C026|nr:ASCH domain-containing protein [Paenibacillus albidus]MBT2289754.1 ASCH domain-containing protein [Paenibacillus albidus]